MSIRSNLNHYSAIYALKELAGSVLRVSRVAVKLMDELNNQNVLDATYFAQN